ncbi:MAG: hypothetical protein Q7R47_06450 [Candidatus Diapherotrites archaeon]|nr:hypothetical protein [Candidatus Diapherotrites archaeon]
MRFFKAVYDALKYSVLIGFVVFIFSANGVALFPLDVNTYYAYVVIFLFFLTATLAAQH